MTKDMEAAREAVRELDETHNLRLHLGKTVVDTLERRIAAALAKVRDKERERVLEALHKERNRLAEKGIRQNAAGVHRAIIVIRALAKEEQKP